MAGKSQGSAPEWIPASEALELLYRDNGGWLGNKFLLAERLKDGKLQARAARLWTSDAPSINSAWKSRADAEAEENVQVETSVWRGSRYWLEDVIDWRWPDNRFLITRTKKPAERTFVEGVEFDSAQVAELLPAKSRKNIGGRNIRAPDWEKIGVALVNMANQGVFLPPDQRGTGRGAFKNKTDFIDKILIATGNVYNRTHAFDILGPIYAHFHPETEALSLRTDDLDSY
jgi:hypothetical protein